LLSPAQGRITHDIRLSLPRPCDRTSPDFLAARREIFAAFELIHEQALEYTL
jgi:NitT/TauT family transport system ATP-binding protein